MMTIPTLNMNADSMPISATLSDEENDDFSVISSAQATSTAAKTIQKPKKSPTRETAASHSTPTLPNEHAYQVQIYGDPAPMQLTLAEWGQRKVTWGKKHPGKTYYQVLSEDMGYFEWSLQRYRSLPPHQQDFVDYCRAQLEADATQDRLKAVNVRRHS